MKLDREPEKVNKLKSFTKTKVEKFFPLWVRLDYSKYTSEFEKIRFLMPYKADHCFKCDGKFKKNEEIALVALKFVGNKVFCRDCAIEIENNKETTKLYKLNILKVKKR